MTNGDEVRHIAAHLLPHTDVSRATVVHGEFHDVVLLPGTAAVKVARGNAAAHLERRARLLDALAGVGLPFAVPRPLGPVTDLGERSAVALSWVEGRTAPAGSGDPQRLRDLLDALAGVDVAHLDGLLDAPHAYAGRDRWASLMLEAVVPLLPPELRAEAAHRIEAAIALPPVPPRLVHGDLAGENLLWNEDGSLAAVLDWDLAQPFDPAVDAACLAWHGWETVRAAVDRETYERATVWFGTFGLEHVAAAIDNGEPDDVVAAAVARAASWLGSG